MFTFHLYSMCVWGGGAPGSPCICEFLKKLNFPPFFIGQPQCFFPSIYYQEQTKMKMSCFSYLHMISLRIHLDILKSCRNRLNCNSGTKTCTANEDLKKWNLRHLVYQTQRARTSNHVLSGKPLFSFINSIKIYCVWHFWWFWLVRIFLLPHTNVHWMKGGWWHERSWVNKFLNKYDDNTASNIQYIYVQCKMSIAGYLKLTENPLSLRGV